MELTSQVANLQDELKLLKGEVKAVLKELRAAVLSGDNPFSAGLTSARPAAPPPDEPDGPLNHRPDRQAEALPAPPSYAPAPPPPSAPPPPPAPAPWPQPAAQQYQAPPPQYPPAFAPPPQAPAQQYQPPQQPSGQYAPPLGPLEQGGGYQPAPPGYESHHGPVAGGTTGVHASPLAAPAPQREPARPELTFLRPVERTAYEEPAPERRCSLVTIASLAAWMEDSLATLGPRRLQLVLELAYFAELLSPEVRDALCGMAQLPLQPEEQGKPFNTNECVMVLRQLEAILQGEQMSRAPRKRHGRRRAR